MLSPRIGFSALVLATALGSGALTDQAWAKGHCAAGQILRVSSGTCVSRAAAIQQGIIGGKRKPHREARAEQSAATPEAVDAKPESAEATESRETTSVARSEPAPPTPARSEAPTVTASAASAPVRIEIVKTEPRPTPPILTPTWPYGELAAFPHRISP